MFKSYTYGDLNFEQIPAKLLDYYNKNKHFNTPFSIIIGTDSQNHEDTKIVSVITIICKGHGGIFFYEVTRQPLIKDVRQKLHFETNSSLEIADKLIEEFEKEEYNELFLNVPISIHVDAGNSDKGKTKPLIPELVGWVKACGYDYEVKPNSFAASSIADKISK